MVLSTETSALESFLGGQFKFLSLSLLAGMMALIRSAPTIYTTFIIKVRQVLSKSATSVIKECEKCHHKVSQVLSQSATILLQREKQENTQYIRLVERY